MPATTTSHDIRSKMEIRSCDFDPDTGADAYVTLNASSSEKGLPIATFRSFFAQFRPTVGTGGITAFQIGGATAADGTGFVAAVSHALGSNPDAVTDYVSLECTAEQIREVVSGATHVCVLLNLVTSTDEGNVTFIRFDPLYGPTGSLTSDYVS